MTLKLCSLRHIYIHFTHTHTHIKKAQKIKKIIQKWPFSIKEKEKKMELYLRFKN